LSGTFSTLDVPGGITINYAGNSVVAAVTGLIAAHSSLIPSMPKFAISNIGGNQATLEWLGGTQLIVETDSSLEPGARWQPVVNVPTIAGSNNFSITLPVTNAAQFFRLRQR
jgi:hypothetical protein